MGLDLYGKILSAAKTRKGFGPFFNNFFWELVLCSFLTVSLLHRPFLFSPVRWYTDRSYFITVRCCADRSYFIAVRCYSDRSYCTVFRSRLKYCSFFFTDFGIKSSISFFAHF